MTRAELDRRKFLQMAAAAGAVTVFPDVEFSHAATEPQASGVVMRPVTLSVNGAAHSSRLTHAPRCWTRCASSSNCSEQRKAVTTASAAPVRCT